MNLKKDVVNIEINLPTKEYTNLTTNEPDRIDLEESFTVSEGIEDNAMELTEIIQEEIENKNEYIISAKDNNEHEIEDVVINHSESFDKTLVDNLINGINADSSDFEIDNIDEIELTENTEDFVELETQDYVEISQPDNTTNEIEYASEQQEEFSLNEEIIEESEEDFTLNEEVIDESEEDFTLNEEVIDELEEDFTLNEEIIEESEEDFTLNEEVIDESEEDFTLNEEVIEVVTPDNDKNEEFDKEYISKGLSFECFEYEPTNLNYDREELLSELQKLNDKYPDKNIFKICDLKYNKRMSIAEIADSQSLDISEVIEILNLIIDRIKD